MVVDDIFDEINIVFVIECYKVSCVSVWFITTVPSTAFVVFSLLFFKAWYGTDKMDNLVLVFNGTFQEAKIFIFKKHINKM